MTISIGESLADRWRRFRERSGWRGVTRKLAGARHAALLVTVVLALLVLTPARSAQQVCPIQPNPECPAPANKKVDIAFLIDRSGSLAVDQLGQTYNVEVEGIVRSLRDPSVIPRDGSIAVSVWTFAEEPNLVQGLKEIGSAADAEAIATIVEGLKCTTVSCTPTGLCPVFGSNAASNYAPAIFNSYLHLNRNHRFGARQALVFASDGHLTDLPEALIEAARVRNAAPTLGIQLELDVLVISAAQNATESADQLVFPQPANDLPGKTLLIKTDKSSMPCASLSDAAVQMEFDGNVLEFASHTRDVIRSSEAPTLPLIVNTQEDPAPKTPMSGTLSLRQAIEIANCVGGGVTITFDKRIVKTISPRVPLPALTAPGIRIDGLGECMSDCLPLVTISGSITSLNSEPSDGILIRSNRDVVRGLKIIGFSQAGVGIGTGCPTDIVGSNLIERNTFENNMNTGVYVLDPRGQPPGVATGQPDDLGQRSFAVSHNAGNTISMNDISGSETLIDLALDGPTPNDPGDADEGPNTLLNFPPTLTAGVTGSGVTLSGQVSGPTASGAIVEIFAITSLKKVSAGRVIDGVKFLKQGTVNADGTFTVNALEDSPTCGYTATVTDVFGNTSELMLPGGGFPKAKTTPLEFAGEAVPSESRLTGSFTIENTGFAPLIVSVDAITRNGFSNNNKRNNDSGQFMIGLPGQAVTINPGFTKRVEATFSPTIPEVLAPSVTPRRASQVLPATVNSTLTLLHNGCSGSDRTVSITGHVTTAVRLIGPDSPRNSPVVTLTRSGDELTARFFVYDSNRDVETVSYEFHDSAGHVVPLNKCCDSLEEIQNKYQAGQSFSVTQKFTNANQHKNVASITVTVCDKGLTDRGLPGSQKHCAPAATSGQIIIKKHITSAHSSRPRPAGPLTLSSPAIVPLLHEGARECVRKTDEARLAGQ